MLGLNDFKSLVKSGPLFAFDFLIKNSKNQYLLGMRNNNPAKGYLFIPGGRVYKDETLEKAFNRISKVELGKELSQNLLKPFGLYEHRYKENYFNDNSFSTHYIVFCIFIEYNINLSDLPKDQHNQYYLMTKKEILESDMVHEFTKSYFIESPKNLFLKF